MESKEELEFKYIELKSNYDSEELKLKKYEDTKRVLVNTIFKNKRDIEVLNDLIELNNVNGNLEKSKKNSQILSCILIAFGLCMTIIDSNVITFNLTRDLFITFLSSIIISGSAYLIMKEKVIKEHDDKRYKDLQKELIESMTIKNQLESYLKSLDYYINITKENMIDIASEIRTILNTIDKITNFQNIFDIPLTKTFQKKKEK